MKNSPISGRERGFSIIEMMVAFAILSVIMAAMTMLMSRMQQIYTAQQRVGGANETGKTAMELMALDIGQSGFPGIVNTFVTQDIVGSNTAQSVTMSSMGGIYLGRALTVGKGSNAEAIRVISCTTTSTVANGCTSGAGDTMTAVFKITHPTAATGLASPAAGVPVTGSMNPLPEGVLLDLSDTAGTFSSTQNILRIVGDLRGDGSLRYIEYRFTAVPSTCTGTLVRSDTDAFASTQNAAVTIADNLCNDSTAGPFSYTTPCQTGVTLTSAQSAYITVLNSDFTPGTSACRPLGTYTYTDSSGTTQTRTLTYVTNIGVTLTLRTQQNVEAGAGAGGARTIVFKEQYFSPRNVVDALIMDDDGLQTILSVAPRAALSSLPAAP